MNKNIKTDEGYIKFQSFALSQKNEIPQYLYQQINLIRDNLFQKKLIGCYPNGISYGNISIRLPESDNFIISGSSTGMYASLLKKQYVLIDRIDISNNQIFYMGEMPPSSESMSHGAIYASSSNINAVIHIHNAQIWLNEIYKLPTTAKEIEYGTPDMAYAIKKLIKKEKKDNGILITGGHMDGIFTYGENITNAMDFIKKYLK